MAVPWSVWDLVTLQKDLVIPELPLELVARQSSTGCPPRWKGVVHDHAGLCRTRGMKRRLTPIQAPLASTWNALEDVLFFCTKAVDKKTHNTLHKTTTHAGSVEVNRIALDLQCLGPRSRMARDVASLTSIRSQAVKSRVSWWFEQQSLPLSQGFQESTSCWHAVIRYHVT